ncbi:phage tail protein, partial [Escherichia coli]|nr:phage tail protein [Escherichia coli]
MSKQWKLCKTGCVHINPMTQTESAILAHARRCAPA